jgi:thiamine biosynthesis lipoprotein
VVPNVESSEIRAINEAAGKSPVPVSPWTERIVLATIRWADRTGGAFDPTIGPLAELWGFGVEVSRAPTEAEIRQALARIGYSKVDIDPDAHTIFLPDEGMRLDVRGGAKGFALDRMKEAMIEAGATSGIMDFAGEMLFFGPGPENGLWPIVLKDPYDPSRNYAYLLLPPGGLSTSTFYDRSVEIGGRRYGHVFDPRTGQPIAGMASVTVYSNEGVVADIVATGLFVVSCKDGPPCAEAAGIVARYPELNAIIVPEPPPGDNAQVTVTPGMRPHVLRLQRPFRPAAEPD